MWPWKSFSLRYTITVLALMAVLSICGVVWERTGGNSDGSKLAEANRLLADIPPYPKAVQTYATASGGGRDAVATRGFQCAAGRQEIKHFYLESLAQHGWEYDDERDIPEMGEYRGGSQQAFHQGQYTLHIFYTGDGMDYGYDYVLSVIWK